MFFDSLKNCWARQEMRQGEVITAEVVLINITNFVVVNAGLKWNPMFRSKNS